MDHPQEIGEAAHRKALATWIAFSACSPVTLRRVPLGLMRLTAIRAQSDAEPLINWSVSSGPYTHLAYPGPMTSIRTGSKCSPACLKA